jgi:hypothetical protein
MGLMRVKLTIWPADRWTLRVWVLGPSGTMMEVGAAGLSHGRTLP